MRWPESLAEVRLLQTHHCSEQHLHLEQQMCPEIPLQAGHSFHSQYFLREWTQRRKVLQWQNFSWSHFTCNCSVICGKQRTFYCRPEPKVPLFHGVDWRESCDLLIFNNDHFLNGRKEVNKKVLIFLEITVKFWFLMRLSPEGSEPVPPWRVVPLL